MKIIWEVEKRDIETVTELFIRQKSNPFVILRFEKNINKKYEEINKETVWKKIVMCLLTTQQRSGPESPISKFLRVNPFPLNYENCKDMNESSIVNVIEDYPGIRRKNKIATEIVSNISFLERNGWNNLFINIDNIKRNCDRESEIDASLYIMENLKGFGPKQSRNLLQSIGITQYEIPLDSRIMDWINNNLSFPIKLRATGLSDINFYNFILDGINILCEKVGIKPCIFDAIVFSSFDTNWTFENAED